MMQESSSKRYRDIWVENRRWGWIGLGAAIAANGVYIAHWLGWL